MKYLGNSGAVFDHESRDDYHFATALYFVYKILDKRFRLAASVLGTLNSMLTYTDARLDPKHNKQFLSLRKVSCHTVTRNDNM